MKNNLSIFCLALLFGFSLPQSAKAEIDNLDTLSCTTVVYGNGVRNTLLYAIKSKLVLTQALSRTLPSSEFNKLNYAVAYNQTGGALRDFAEAALQNVQTNWSRFWRALSGIDILPQALQDKLLNIAIASDTNVAINNSDLAKHIQFYQSQISQGIKIVLVPHSQGNFFANQAYVNLTAEEQASFGIVSVANPDSFVADGGAYTTLTSDNLIKTLSRLVGALPPNISNGSFSFLFFPLGHNFMAAYMKVGSNSEQKILGDIRTAISNLVIPKNVVRTLASNSVTPLDYFVGDISINGNKVLTSNTSLGRGEVYLFDAITNTLINTFISGDAKLAYSFGGSISISGDNVLIGAEASQGDIEQERGIPGLAFLYDASTGKQLHKFTESDGNQVGDYFGRSVAISGDNIVIGAPGYGSSYDRNATPKFTRGSGAAYLFDAKTGKRLRRFIANDDTTGTSFGSLVAISGNNVLIGATGKSFDLRVYLFDASTGKQLHKFTDNRSRNGFGMISISGNNVLLDGQLFDANTGKFLYDVSTPTYSETSPSFTQAIYENNILIARPLDKIISYQTNFSPNYRGAVYIYDATSNTLINKITEKVIISRGSSGFGANSKISKNKFLIPERQLRKVYLLNKCGSKQPNC